LLLFFKKEALPAAPMKGLVLGSAAGGGFPQWNCGCSLCALARAGDPRARPRTQVGMAATADGLHWLLIGASPDLRQQILQTPALAPRAPRHSPIAGVVLVSADIDGLAGLLTLREQQPLRIFAPAPILRILAENRLFAALDPALVERVAITPGEPMQTEGGLTLTLLEMPGKIPLYHEDRAAAAAETAATYAARLDSAGRTAIIAPACADITETVLAKLAAAHVLFFDATLYRDDEMILAGAGHKTGRRMGHVSLCGPDGALARLAGLTARRIFFHINNTNPILLDGSPERREVEARGYEVAFDGMEVEV
jgi:pyrroloquinoline quinone biosynthesis protein B